MGIVTAHSDQELIDASRRGDRAAFGAIVERYQRVVTAVSYSGTGDRALGEDVAQDTFVTAWRQLDSLRDADCLPAWLCGIARNLTRSVRRQRGREEALDDRDLAADSTPYDAMSERETELAVAAALARVPETYREPLVLFYGAQRSIKDVATALGITEQAAQRRLSRGRQYLAGDGAGLVEHTLATRRPRRDLAAAVIAMLGVSFASSRVEASTTAKGSTTMYKIAATAAALVAITAGTGYVVHRSSTDASAPATDTPITINPASTTEPGSARSASTRPTRRVQPVSFVRSAHVAAADDPAGTGDARGAVPADVPLTCESVGRRYGEMIMDLEPDFATLSPEQRQTAIQPAIDHFTETCRAEQWSADFVRCFLSADDLFNAEYCHPEEGPSVAKRKPAKAAPIPAAGLDDLGCGAVGIHMTALSRPAPGFLDNPDIPAEARARFATAMERAYKEMPAQIEAACSRGSWPEATRKCLLLATTTQDADTCMATRN